MCPIAFRLVSASFYCLCKDFPLYPVVCRCLPWHLYCFVKLFLLLCNLLVVCRCLPLPPVASRCLPSSPVVSGCVPMISRYLPLPRIVSRRPPVSPVASRCRPSAPVAARCFTSPRVVSCRIPSCGPPFAVVSGHLPAEKMTFVDCHTHAAECRARGATNQACSQAGEQACGAESREATRQAG